jgi:hypothetical protein
VEGADLNAREGRATQSTPGNVSDVAGADINVPEGRATPSTCGNVSDVAGADLNASKGRATQSSPGNVSEVEGADLNAREGRATQSTPGNVSDVAGADINVPEGRATPSTCGNVSDVAGADLNAREGRTTQSMSGNVSGVAGADLNASEGRATPSTSGNVSEVAGADLEVPEGRATLTTSRNVSDPSLSGLYWMPDVPAPAQSTGKEEEKGVSVEDPPAASGKKTEEDRSGKDLQEPSAIFLAGKANASLNRAGDGTKAEAAATAKEKGGSPEDAAAARNQSGAGNTVNGSSMGATALQQLRAHVARKGRVALDVGGGGKCQYLAFADQIRKRFAHLPGGTADITWQRICSLLADWLAQNRWHEGEDSSRWLLDNDGWDGVNWEGYVSKVRHGRVWGNELTAIAMAHVFETPVHVWTCMAGAGVEYNGFYPDGLDSTHPGTAIEVGHVFENHYLSVFERRDLPAAANNHAKRAVPPTSGSEVLSKQVQPEPQPLQDPRLVLHGLLLELRRRLAVRPASTGAVDPETVRELLALVPSLLDSTPPDFYGPALAFAREMQRLAAEAGVQTEELWEKVLGGKPVPVSKLDLAEDAAVRDKNNHENQMIHDRNRQRWKDHEATARELREFGGVFPRRGKGGTWGKSASRWTQGKSALRGAATKPPHSDPGYE